MINIEYLKNLVECMPRRLQAVIDGNSHLTKYKLKLYNNGLFSGPKQWALFRAKTMGPFQGQNHIN